MNFRTILLIGAAALTLSACGKTPIHDTTPSKRTSKGFDLTVKEDSILLPLEYMEGIDGLMKRKAFDGIYGVVNGGPGYVSREDLSREDWESTFPEHQTSGEVFNLSSDYLHRGPNPKSRIGTLFPVLILFLEISFNSSCSVVYYAQEE